jgi:hypothetical protein
MNKEFDGNELTAMMESYREREEKEDKLLEQFNKDVREPDAFVEVEGTFGYGYWHLPGGEIVRLRKNREGQYNNRYFMRVYEKNEVEAMQKALASEPRGLKDEVVV